MKSSTFYIEDLTVCTLVFSILPYFFKNRFRTFQENEKIYYFNNSGPGLLFARLILRPIKIQVEQVKFSQGETRDHDGNLIWMKTIEDAIGIQDNFKDNPVIQKVLKQYKAAHRLQPFLSRCMLECDLKARNMSSMLELIYFIRIIDYRENSNGIVKASGQNVYYFMYERPWSSELEQFAQKRKINIISTGAHYFYIKKYFLIFNGFKSFIKQIIYYGMVVKYYVLKMMTLKKFNLADSTKNVFKQERGEKVGLRPRVLVEYYGHLNFDSPELYSDLFFCQESSLSAKDILIYFGLPRAPIADKELKEIKKYGLSAVAINSRAAATPDVDVFRHKQQTDNTDQADDIIRDEEHVFAQRWVQQYIKNYHARYNFWVDFITRHNIKTHVSWNKHISDHSVILDALQDTGGVGAVYQRSFEHFPTPWTYTTADVVFGFSEYGAHKGCDQRSSIPYYIIVGYLGDYRFTLLQKQANDVRNSLTSHGANRIAAYFDENPTNHPRWNFAYKTTIENYSYLLNKVLENPWFGLILKPKNPATLRSKLGSVSDLLKSAEKTGRCFIYEGGVLQGSYPPVAASLGADVAIHGHFFAATAGVEAALAGTPTLFLDYEGMPRSPLYKLKKDKVIFKDIDSLWNACEEHWNRPGGIPMFGDWSNILNELDPFRDGRAAERMGTYLEWLIEGFKAGLPRETVLADAAQRYGKIWGKDKIISKKISEDISTVQQGTLCN